MFRNNYLLPFFLAASSILPAAASTLYIAPTGQSAVVTYSVPGLSQSNRFPAGGNAASMALSPDGTAAYVAAPLESAVVKYSVSTGQVLATYPTPQPTSIALSPDGSMLYVVTSRVDTLSAFNTATGAEIGPVPSGLESSQIVVSPDGNALYVAANSDIYHFDAQTLQKVGMVPLEGESFSLAFGPTSGTLYALSNSAFVVFIDTEDDTVVSSVQIPKGGFGLAVNPAGSTLYIASHGLVEVSTATAQIVGTIDASQILGSVAISPDGTKALCALIESLNDPHFNLVEVSLSSGDVVQTVATDGSISSAIYSPTGTEVYTLLSGTFDIDFAPESGNMVTGLIRGVFPNGLLVSSLDGSTIAGAYYGELYTINTASKQITGNFHFAAPTSPAQGAALNSNGTVALVGLSNPPSLEILTLASGASKTVPIPSDTPLSMTVSPDDQTAYVVGNKLCSVDIPTGAVKLCGPQLEQHFANLLRTVAIDSTGTKLFVFDLRSVHVYDSSSLDTLAPTIPVPDEQNPYAITYSAANNSVYVISNHNGPPLIGTVMRIDADSFAVVATQTYGHPLSDIAVSQDGTKVYLAEDPVTNESQSYAVKIVDGTTLTAIGDIIPDIAPMSLVSAN